LRAAAACDEIEGEGLSMNSEIKLHLGIHKTASTHLQNLMANHNTGVLHSMQTHFYPPREIREPVVRVVHKTYAERKAGGPVTKSIADAVAPLLKSHSRIIVADENLIGSCQELYHNKQPYPRAQQLLSVLAEGLTAGRVSEVYLAVRSYDTFLASAYCEAIRNTREFITFEEYTRHLAPEELSWSSLVRSVTDVFPQSRVFVWRFEDYRRLEPAIVNSIAGASVHGRFSSGAGAIVYPSPSQKTISALAALKDVLSRKELSTLRPRLEKMFPKSDTNPAFNPWQPAASLYWKEKYRRDMAELSSISNVTLLE
jgi:hypothetical protein